MYTLAATGALKIQALSGALSYTTPPCIRVLQAHLKWAHGLTSDTRPYLDLIFVVLKEGAENVSTSAAVELDHLQLRENACPSCHHPLEFDQAVQVMLPAHPELLLPRSVTKTTELATGLKSLVMQCCSSFYMPSEIDRFAVWSQSDLDIVQGTRNTQQVSTLGCFISKPPACPMG